MSWNVNAASVIAKDVIGDLQTRFAQQYPAPTPEVVEQFSAALDAITRAVPTVQPDPLGFISVSASGHANPNHVKTAGWANDSFAISLYQA